MVEESDAGSAALLVDDSLGGSLWQAGPLEELVHGRARHLILGGRQADRPRRPRPAPSDGVPSVAAAAAAAAARTVLGLRLLLPVLLHASSLETKSQWLAELTSSLFPQNWTIVCPEQAVLSIYTTMRGDFVPQKVYYLMQRYR